MSQNGEKKLFIEIQVLRGFAILLVVAFHLKTWFPNTGYIGVDIFFVISGFLMQHLHSQAVGSKAVRKFYIKRAKRILPAYTATLTIFTILGLLVLHPNEKYLLLKSLLPNTLFVSNFYNWTQEQYFASETFRPFLNLWSLSVEVQFYLLVPFIILLQRKKISRIILVLGWCLSFFSFILAQTLSPNSAFFLTPFRLWEFGLGMFASYKRTEIGKLLKKRFNHAEIGFSPLLLLLFIVILLQESRILDFTESQFVITIACLAAGALAMVDVGCSYHSSSILYRTLTLIGKYSYELYLVHFPILVLMNYKPLSGNSLISIDITSKVIYICLLIITSYIVFIYVQKKSQNSSKTWQHIFLFTIFLIPLSFIVGKNALAVALFQSSNQERILVHSALDRAEFRCGILYRVDAMSSLLEQPKACELAESEEDDSLLLIGNSHADSIKQTVAKVSLDLKLRPLLAQENENVNQDNLGELLELVQQTKPRIILLHSSSGSYNLSILKKFIQEVSKVDSRVLVLGSTPIFRENIPQVVHQSPNKNAIQLSSSYKMEFNRQQEQLRNLVEDLDSKFTEVISSFCNKSFLCEIRSPIDGKLYFFDTNHLTLTGAEVVEEILRQGIRSSLDSSK